MATLGSPGQTYFNACSCQVRFYPGLQGGYTDRCHVECRSAHRANLLGSGFSAAAAGYGTGEASGLPNECAEWAYAKIQQKAPTCELSSKDIHTLLPDVSPAAPHP